jgi:hypothetical protein
MKRCPNCKENKRIADFSKASCRYDGLQSEKNAERFVIDTTTRPTKPVGRILIGAEKPFERPIDKLWQRIFLHTRVLTVEITMSVFWNSITCVIKLHPSVVSSKTQRLSGSVLKCQSA